MAAERNFEELYPRAPRYMVEVGDNDVVRFAHMPKGSKTMHTRIINISESGMAFLVPYLTAPQIDEMIKVQFTAPNAESVACYAKVVRVQVHRTYHKTKKPQTFKMVAVEFENLHPTQRQMLSTGITEQLKKKQAEYRRDQIWTQCVWFFMDLGSKLRQLLAKLPIFRKSSAKKVDDNNYIDA